MDAIAANEDNPNLKTSSTKPNQRKELLAKKWSQMKRLEKGRIDLLDYMTSIGHHTMNLDQRVNAAIYDMSLEKDNELSTSFDDILIEELSEMNDTEETTPMKAPLKGKELQKKRLENATQSFNDSHSVIHSKSVSEQDFSFHKFLQDESQVIMTSDMKMALDEAEMEVQIRLSEKNFILSPDQEKTTADGKHIILHYL